MKPKTQSKPISLDTGKRKKPSVSAKSKAVSLLARREHSQIELKNKLLQRGYDPAEVVEAVEWAQSHQFQSDERFKLSLFRRRASTFGDRAIASELSQHGLDGLQKQPLDAEQDQTVFSEEERAYEWIMRRQTGALSLLLQVPDEADASRLLALKSKIYKALSSRGFEFSNIDRAWRRVLAEFKSNA